MCGCLEGIFLHCFRLIEGLTLSTILFFPRKIPPTVYFNGRFTPVDLSSPQRGIVVFPSHTIVPEILQNRLVSPYISVTLVNANVTGQTIPPPTPPPASHDSESETEAGKVVFSDLSESGWVQIMDARGVDNQGNKVRHHLIIS
jgi:hypothetical protein